MFQVRLSDVRQCDAMSYAADGELVEDSHEAKWGVEKRKKQRRSWR
jgi:hypothetical protein